MRAPKKEKVETYNTSGWNVVGHRSVPIVVVVAKDHVDITVSGYRLNYWRRIKPGEVAVQ